MKYAYGEFDGDEFPTQDKLFGFDQLMQFIMQYGDQALKDMQQMMNDPQDGKVNDLLEEMLKDGMLDKDGKGKLRLTPRAVTKMKSKALLEVFRNLKQGHREGHQKITSGQGGDRLEGTKTYEFGDPISELDLHQTLQNAMKRSASDRAKAHASGAGIKGKINFSERYFEIHLREGMT